jgi:hypothetical protein
MAEILAYGFRRRPADLAALGARRVYVDHDGRREDRAQLIADVRRGDVVRVLYSSDLGGAQWKRWAAAIEAKGGAVEEMRPAAPPKPGGRPRKLATTPDQDRLMQAAWCDGTASLDVRLDRCAAICGRQLGREHRHILYGRYGRPGAPKALRGNDTKER